VLAVQPLGCQPFVLLGYTSGGRVAPQASKNGSGYPSPGLMECILKAVLPAERCILYVKHQNRLICQFPLMVTGTKVRFQIRVTYHSAITKGKQRNRVTFSSVTF
jgi:hypothetical protein